jgi:isoleucyl-tRNA synthetase
MDRVRDVCSAALALRDAHKLRTRLPLSRLTVAGANVHGLAPYAELIKDEINVKGVSLQERAEDFGHFELQVNSRAVGKKLGQDMKAVLAAAKSGDYQLLPDGRARVGTVTLEHDEFSMLLRSKEGVASQGLPSNDAVVVLDTTVTPELEREGWVRDLVRGVQQTRKDAAFNIADTIELSVEAPSDVQHALGEFEDYVLEQTLAVKLHLGPPGADAHTSLLELAGVPVRIGVQRARAAQ